MQLTPGAIIAVYESEGDPPLGRQLAILALSSSKVHLPSLKSSMAWGNTDCCFGVISATSLINCCASLISIIIPSIVLQGRASNRGPCYSEIGQRDLPNLVA